MSLRLSSLASSLTLVALSACAADAGEPDATASATSSALDSCVASSMLAGNGLFDDLRDSVDRRFFTPRAIAVPGALRVGNPGFSPTLDPVEAAPDATLVAERDSIAAVLGTPGGPHGLFGNMAEDAAERLFNAMTRARETNGDDGRTRWTERGLVSCTEFRTTPASHECTIRGVRSVSPAADLDFDLTICGLIGCRMATLRTEPGVIADLLPALTPGDMKSDVGVGEVLDGTLGKGSETIKIVAGVRVDDPTLIDTTNPRLRSSFGGRESEVGNSGEKKPGYRAAKALFEAMTRARETQNPKTGATDRVSPSGRVLCTKIVEDDGLFYNCNLSDIRRFGPFDSAAAGGTVCATPAP